MRIRQAKISDIDNIMRMYKSCVNGMIEENIDQWDDTYPNKDIIIKDIVNKTYYIYILNNTIVGGINIDSIQDKTYLDIKWDDTEDKYLVVHRLGIRKEYWNKGIGRKLMLFTESLVLEKKLNSIRLDTYSNNPIAINFYLKLGFSKKR